MWNGKTYVEIAGQHNYDYEYVKGVGCNLWQTLSRTFDKQINKSNFVPFMRQQIAQLVEENISPSAEASIQSSSCKLEDQPRYHWTTAPDLKFFAGRGEELNTLELWSQDPKTRCIVVSGMVGSGKTALVSELAKRNKDKFDYVIGFSLLQTPSLTTLLHRYLKIITQTNVKYSELSFLLAEFINCLKKKRILLILDDLHCIFETDKRKKYNQEKVKEYSQFLSSLISIDHQSLLITTSSIQLKMLEYYSESQVRMLDLQGFKIKTCEAILNSHSNISLEAEQLSFLSKSVQSNPQLLNIVKNHLHDFKDFLAEDIEHILSDIVVIEGISNLLEQELFYLSDLEKEIIYWLAISCHPVTLEELSLHVEKSQSKLKFIQSIKSLIKRTLVINHDSTYSLMPIMKIYVRKKLVKQALRVEIAGLNSQN
ncbi:MAG: ATP-binding protein [Hydrococcus sp. SU_1_0]|nr:ATP-binding protein [Hydrococcus sp. SU_1_0]